MDALIYGSQLTAASTTVTEYASLEGSGLGAFATTAPPVQQVIPHDLTLSDFYISLSAAPGSGKSWTIHLRQNNSNLFTITIADAATSGSYTGAPLAFTAGDLVDVEFIPSGTPAAPQFAWVIRQKAAGQYAILGGKSNGTVATYVPCQGRTAGNVTEDNIIQIMPHACTITNLYMISNVDPSSSSWVATLSKNNVDQALTATMAAGSTSAHDTAHSISVAAGDKISTHITTPGTPATSRVGASYTVVPTTDGQSAIMFINSTLASATAVNYNYAQGTVLGSWATVESTQQTLSRATTLTAFYCRQVSGVGSGKSYPVLVRKNSADTALTVTLDNTAGSTKNITGQSVAVADGDFLNIKSTGVAGGSSTILQWGILSVVTATTTAVSDVPSDRRTRRRVIYR